MAQMQHTPPLLSLEEAITVLFCLIDDAYANLNPRGRCYRSLKRLSDSEVITLALFQQLRGIESERSFLRDAQRFLSHLFSGVVDLAPSSFHRRLRNLRCFLEPLRRTVLNELVGDPETLIVDSTLLSVLHPKQVGQSVGFAGAMMPRPHSPSKPLSWSVLPPHPLVPSPAAACPYSFQTHKSPRLVSPSRQVRNLRSRWHWSNY